jgi:hypothetical protein
MKALINGLAGFVAITLTLMLFVISFLILLNLIQSLSDSLRN